MSEARKRARSRAAKPDASEPVPEAAAPAPPQLPPPGEAAAAELTFPDEQSAQALPPGRIALPASGTAEEILALTEAATHEPPLAPEVAEAVESVVQLSPPAPGHSVSFFSAPAREERAAAEATEHLVTFFLDREEYGVDVRLVQEIRRVAEITPVPRAPDFIKGVINLRGRIIPVVDLKRKLLLGEVVAGRSSRIVVVKLAERLIGLLVDGASQVPKVPVASIEPPPDEVVEKGGDYIRGVAKLVDKLIILVDLHKVLVLEEREGTPKPAPASGALVPRRLSS